MRFFGLVSLLALVDVVLSHTLHIMMLLLSWDFLTKARSGCHW